MTAIQLDRLNRVVAAAGRTEPYRRLWGGTARPFRDLSELKRLPPITRAQLQESSFAKRLVPGRVADYTSVTSGTTGYILEIARTEDEQRFLRAALIRQWRFWGWTETELHLRFNLGVGRSAPLTLNGLRAEVGASRPIPEQIAALEQIRPRRVVGPPSTLLEIADHLSRYPLEGVATFGEVLDPGARSELRSAFGAEPLDFYGSSEAGTIAWQCPAEGSYHINADTVLVEIMDGDDGVKKGDEGEVIISTLWNETTPIVRYRTGDGASLSPEPCPCGIPLPVMSQVQGRRMDWVRHHDGRRVAPFRVFAIISVPETRAVMRRFRFVQRALDDCLMEVVWRGEPQPGLLESRSGRLSRLLGGPVNVEVRTVESLPIQAGTVRLIESWVTDEGTGDSDGEDV
ncbi:MAG: phenylacetate--CoA ligase family protein [Actinomycetota bacterium]